MQQITQVIEKPFDSKAKATVFMHNNDIEKQTLVKANSKWYVVYEAIRTQIDGDIEQGDQYVATT